jgi:hypothetical protein
MEAGAVIIDFEEAARFDPSVWNAGDPPAVRFLTQHAGRPAQGG